jgi:hypothetical protein
VDVNGLTGEVEKLMVVPKFQELVLHGRVSSRSGRVVLVVSQNAVL